ncbi:hypothetical protein BH20ACT18_BH20ACT18_13770 [soil metagenome]
MRTGTHTTDSYSTVAQRDTSVRAFAFEYVYAAWRFS